LLRVVRILASLRSCFRAWISTVRLSFCGRLWRWVAGAGFR